MQRLTVLLSLAALLIVAACGPTQVVITPTAAPNATPGAAGNAIMVLERSGTLKGGTEKWTAYDTGVIESSNGTKFAARPGDVKAALDRIANLGFFELEDSYGQSGTCYDCTTYRLTISNAGITKTVTAVQESPDTPDSVIEMMRIAVALASGVQDK